MAYSDGDKTRETAVLDSGEFDGFTRMVDRKNDRLNLANGEVYVRDGRRDGQGRAVFRRVGKREGILDKLPVKEYGGE